MSHTNPSPKSHPGRSSSNAILEQWVAKHHRIPSFTLPLVYRYSPSTLPLYFTFTSSVHPTLLESKLLYSTLVCSALPLPYSTLVCSTLLFSALLYSDLLYSSLLYSTLLFCAPGTCQLDLLIFDFLLYFKHMPTDLMIFCASSLLQAQTNWTHRSLS